MVHVISVALWSILRWSQVLLTMLVKALFLTWRGCLSPLWFCFLPGKGETVCGAEAHPGSTAWSGGRRAATDLSPHAAGKDKTAESKWEPLPFPGHTRGTQTCLLSRYKEPVSQTSLTIEVGFFRIPVPGGAGHIPELPSCSETNRPHNSPFSERGRRAREELERGWWHLNGNLGDRYMGMISKWVRALGMGGGKKRGNVLKPSSPEAKHCAKQVSAIPIPLRSTD